VPMKSIEDFDDWFFSYSFIKKNSIDLCFTKWKNCL
jgi:hypothetical protein